MHMRNNARRRAGPMPTSTLRQRSPCRWHDGCRRPAPSEGAVYVVDDDASIRHALSSLVRALGCQERTFANADDFLMHAHADRPGCPVLDMYLPGSSGLELQQ